MKDKNTIELIFKEILKHENKFEEFIFLGKKPPIANKCFQEIKEIIKQHNAPDYFKEDDSLKSEKDKIYREKILPKYDNDPDKVPPHLEPDYNDGWK